MNKKYHVDLTPTERTELETIVKTGKAAAKKILHAQILLKADRQGPSWSDDEIAETFSIHTNTVRAVRERFVNEGLESAITRKKQSRPSREPKFDGEKEARLIAVACGQAPEGRTRWTLRLLAGRVVELKIVDSVSHETVRQALKKTNSSRT